MRIDRNEIYGYKEMMLKIQKIEDIAEILEKAEKPMLAREVGYKLAELGYPRKDCRAKSLGHFLGCEMRKFVNKEDVPCDYTITVKHVLTGWYTDKKNRLRNKYEDIEITPKQRFYSIK